MRATLRTASHVREALRHAGTAFGWLMRFARVVEPGQVSHATAALLEGDRSVPELRSLGERTIRELDEPVQIYELVESQVPSP
jgi:class 3 adenylate cyclase